MGFNKRKMDSGRAAVAAKEAKARRALGPQIVEDAKRLVADWNERQSRHMPLLYSPTIEAALLTNHWFLWVRCPACRTTAAVDLRRIDRHPGAAVTSLILALSCRGCRPDAPFAELVRLSKTDIAEEMREEHRRQVMGE
jgi:hypothetical protein